MWTRLSTSAAKISGLSLCQEREVAPPPLFGNANAVEAMFKHPDNGEDEPASTSPLPPLNAALSQTHSHPEPPPPVREDEAYWTARAKEFEREWEQVNTQHRILEAALIEAKENAVISRPINYEDCVQQAELYSKEIFDIQSVGKHINVATEVFDLEEMLKKVRLIREEFPGTLELKHTYDVLETELCTANGRRLEKKQELLGELDYFLSLKKDVLKLEPAENVGSNIGYECEDWSEDFDEDVNRVRPEHFERSRLREAQVRKRLMAIQKSLVENNRLEEATLHLSSNQASLAELENYFSTTIEKLVRDIERLKVNKQQFKASQGQRIRELEDAKLKLRFEKEALFESIRTKRAQIEADMTKLIHVVVQIREQERAGDQITKVDHKMEEILAEVQRTLNNRVEDSHVGATVSRIQQGIGESIKEDCSKRLQERRTILEGRYVQTQFEFYNLSKSHWNKCVWKFNQAAEQLKEYKRLLGQESNALRKQKKQTTDDKLSDKGIIRLQEALCEQRLRLLNEKKSEQEYWRKELALIDSNLSQMGTPKCLQESSMYKSHVEIDFRDEFLRSEKQKDAIDWIENIKDLLAAVCDMKDGVINTAHKDEPNTEPLESLLDILDSMEDKGGMQQMSAILFTRSDLLNQLRMMHTIIRDVIDGGTVNSSVIVYGRSLRASLSVVKSKLGVLLQCGSDDLPRAAVHAGKSKEPSLDTK